MDVFWQSFFVKTISVIFIVFFYICVNIWRCNAYQMSGKIKENKTMREIREKRELISSILFNKILSSYATAWE